jgi:hypothetical protein
MTKFNWIQFYNKSNKNTIKINKTNFDSFEFEYSFFEMNQK